jgi:hypothetical protein
VSFNAKAQEQPHLIRCYTPDNAEGQEYYETEAYGFVTRPEGWHLWCVHSEEAEPPYPVPEIKLTEVDGEAEPVYPERWHGDERSLALFSAWGRTIGGVYRVEDVTPGTRYRFEVQAHAWNSNGDKADVSDGVGSAAFAMPHDAIPQRYDDQKMVDILQSCAFQVGLDPTGGTDPYADTVIWGTCWSIYNEFAPVAVEAVATGATMTRFVRTSNKWRTKHNDRYIAAPVWEVVGEPDEPGPPAPPVERAMVPPGLHVTLGDNGASDELRALHEQMVREFPEATPAQIAAALPTIKVYGVPEMANTLRLFKRINPHIRTTFRLSMLPGYDINIEGPSLDPDPVTAAGRVWDALMDVMADYLPLIDILEIINEQDADHVKLGLFFKELGRLGRRDGVTVGAFSYSLGVPEWDEMRAVVETGVFDDPEGLVLCLHEYADPMDKWFGDALPGYDGDASDKGPLAFRYRYWLEILRARGLFVPVALTEVNLARKMTEISGEEWERQMRWYLTKAAEDPEVTDVHLFSWGPWRGFDIRMHLSHWRAIAVDAARAILSVEPEEPDPEPEPEPGYDRRVLVVDYDRIQDEAIREVLYQEARQRGIYCGPSHDEAANRPPNARTSTIELPGFSEDDVDYIAFYAERDPEAVLVFRPLPNGGEPPPAGQDPEPELEIVDVRDRMATNPQSPWYPWRRRQLSEINTVFVHHSAGALSSDIATVKAIARYHVAPDGKNRPGICYSYVIGADGTIWQTSDLENVVFGQGSASHPGDENWWGIAVCLLGRFIDGREPTDAQMASLVALIDYLEEVVGKGLSVWGHKDVIGTQCPGDSWPWLAGWGKDQPPPPDPTSVRGVHGPISTAPPEDLDALIGRLRMLGVRWYKLLFNGHPGTYDLMDKLMGAGIQPVVRIYDDAQLPGRNQVIVNGARAVRQMIGTVLSYNAAHGTRFKPFMEVMNELNLTVEWQPDYHERVDWHDVELVNQAADSWWLDAVQIVEWGGCPAIPAMGPTERGGLNPRYSSWMWFKGFIARLMATHGYELPRWIRSANVWLAVHSAAFARPFDYEPTWGQGVDDMCLRGYEPYRRWIREKTGEDEEITTIITEGVLYSPFHMWELNWCDEDLIVRLPDGTGFYDEVTWGQRLREAFDYLAQRGEVAGACAWHLADAGSSSEWWGGGWYDLEWGPRSPVVALADR